MVRNVYYLGVGSERREGWCDGATYPSISFPALGPVLGAVGDAQFNVPDLRGRTVLGRGQMEPGATGGAEQVTLTSLEITGHSCIVGIVEHCYKTSAFADTSGAAE